jgi:hypothetical protein
MPENGCVEMVFSLTLLPLVRRFVAPHQSQPGPCPQEEETRAGPELVLHGCEGTSFCSKHHYNPSNTHFPFLVPELLCHYYCVFKCPERGCLCWLQYYLVPTDWRKVQID